MSAKYQDYYQTLGVARTASAEEIARAYRQIARENHPDVNKAPEAERRFKEAGEAYEVLKDPEKRRRYDALGANWKNGQEFRPPPGWGGVGGARRGGRSGPGGQGAPDFGDVGGGAFSEFFESLFGGGGFGDGDEDARVQPRSRRGRDVEAEITVALADVYHGSTREVTLADGSGPDRRISVKIPRGVSDGGTIRLAGQGSPSPGGGTPGDLLLKVRVAPDPRFRVGGGHGHHDLVTTLKLTPSEAALGAKVSVETFEGEITLTVPAGSSSGTVLRIRGRGLPNKSGGHGDLLAEVRVCVPRELNADERVLYEKLAQASNFNPRAS